MITDISKYSAYFHDGAVIDIQYVDREIIFSLESAEMDISELQDDIQLSKFMTIKGKLHLNGVETIQLNESPFCGRLKMEYDSANIFDLIIEKNKVILSLSWVNFPPKSSINDFSTIEIEAEKIWWENIPDLLDPFSLNNN